MSVLRLIGALGSLLFGATIARADVSAAWVTNSDGAWSVGGNWQGGVAPTGVTGVASFTNTITAVRLISVDSSPWFVNALIFSNTGTYGWTVAGGSLVLAGTAPAIAVAPASTAAVSAQLTGSAGLTKSDAGTLKLSGANSYSGGTAILDGTVEVNTGGTLGDSGGAVNLGSGSSGNPGTVGNLTINTGLAVGALNIRQNTADIVAATNIAQLLIASGVTLTSAAFTVGQVDGGIKAAVGTGSVRGGGGALAVTGNVAIGAVPFYVPTPQSLNAADLSGLSSFGVSATSTGYLRVGYGSMDWGTMTLASNNTINCGTISVGDSGGQNYIGGHSYLYLGPGSNILQSTTFTIGAGKGSGTIQFEGANGTVSITGEGGVGTASITLGVGGGTYQQTGTNALLLAGHAVSVNAGAVVVGQSTGGQTRPVIALLTFDSGSFAATSMVMGYVGAGGMTAVASVVFGSSPDSTGVVAVGSVFNIAKCCTPTGVSTGSVTINGGMVSLGCPISDASTAGVSVTAMVLDGGSLDMTGHAIGGDGSDGNRAVGRLSFLRGTLKNVSQINAGNTPLVKTGGGTLVLAGTNTYTGSTLVSNGTLQVDGVLSGSVVVVSSNTILSGSGRIAGAATVIETGGTLAVTNVSAVLALGATTNNGTLLLTGDSAGNGGRISVDGGLELGATSALLLSSTNNLSWLQRYTAVTVTNGIISGRFATNNLPSSWTISYEPYRIRFMAPPVGTVMSVR